MFLCIHYNMKVLTHCLDVPCRSKNSRNPRGNCSNNTEGGGGVRREWVPHVKKVRALSVYSPFPDVRNLSGGILNLSFSNWIWCYLKIILRNNLSFIILFYLSFIFVYRIILTYIWLWNMSLGVKCFHI